MYSQRVAGRPLTVQGHSNTRRKKLLRLSSSFRLSLTSGPVYRAEQGAEAGGGQVFVNAYAVQRAAIVQTNLDIGSCLRIAAGANGVLAVVHDLHLCRQGRDQGFQGALADTAPMTGFAG